MAWAAFARIPDSVRFVETYDVLDGCLRAGRK
jgi:hypothetical protein